MSDPLPLTCPDCGQPAQPEDRFCSRCAYPLRQSCRVCRQEAPIWARFCPNCGAVFAQPGAQHEESTERQGVVGFGLPGGAQMPTVPGASAIPQVGAPGVPGASAIPQTGAPGVPGASAVPQTGAPGVPTASAPPQSGAPTAPTGPQGGPPHLSSMPGASQAGTAARVAGHAAGKTAARSLGSKLLGTATAKVITAVVAVAVVATSAFAVAAATGHNPLAGGSQKPSSNTGSGGAHSPTATPPPPPEVTYVGGDGNVWDMTLPQGSPRQLTTDARPNSNTGYFGLAWSPDGKRLAVGRVSGSPDSPTYRLRVLSSEGAVLFDVSLPGGLAAGAFVPNGPDDRPFAWSPDGRFIAYRETTGSVTSAGNDVDTFYLFDSQAGSVVKHFTFDRGESGCGGGPAPLTDATGTLHDAYEHGIDTFAWSPDQQTILVTYGCVDLESARLNISSGKVVPGYPEGATYQPGGNLILGDWLDFNSGAIILGIVDASNQHVRTLASEQEFGSSGAPGPYEIPLGEAAWGSSGQSIYYEHDDGIWQIGADGSNAHLLVSGSQLDSQGNATVDVAPQPSPDGKMLLYVRVRGTDLDPNTIVQGQWYLAQDDGTGQTALPQMSFQFTENGNGFGGVGEIVWRPGT